MQRCNHIYISSYQSCFRNTVWPILSLSSALPL